jgi:hypothetical protein
LSQRLVVVRFRIRAAITLRNKTMGHQSEDIAKRGLIAATAD